jgi:hypothetical protein
VHEYVLTTLAADKTITFGVVKPLYRSCFHDVAWFLFLLDCAPIHSLDFCRQVTPVGGKYWKLHSAVQAQTQLNSTPQPHKSAMII